MKIFNYHPITGEYISESVADESPLEPGKYLIPAFATELEPPTIGDRQVAVFNNGAWSLVADYRGQTVYDTTTGAESTVVEPGEIPSGKTPTAPPEYPAKWADGAWIADLEQIKTNKLASLKFSRNASESDTPFIYDGSNFDYDILSRERINAAVAAATIAALSGMAASTVLCEWTLSDNTKRQMTIGDWLSFKQAEVVRSAACHSNYNTLKAQVEAATTIDEIKEVK